MKKKFSILFSAILFSVVITSVMFAPKEANAQLLKGLSRCSKAFMRVPIKIRNVEPIPPFSYPLPKIKDQKVVTPATHQLNRSNLHYLRITSQIPDSLRTKSHFESVK